MEIIENPISHLLTELYENTKNEINICVPFMSTYVKRVFKEKVNCSQKRIIVNLDESNFSSYNLEAMKYLLKNNFKIRFNNDIHMKLYIFDNNSIIGSSNLTENGLKNNIELSIIENNNKKEKIIFKKIWDKSEGNEIDLKYIEENWTKYLILKSRRSTNKNVKPDVKQNNLSLIKDLKIDDLLNFIIKNDLKTFKEHIKKYSDEAVKIRNRRILDLKNGYNIDKIYVENESSNRRRDCLFHDLEYSPESHLATTGLREYQFRQAFTDLNFKKIVNFILPETLGMNPWNLEIDNEYLELSKGIFDFKVKQYVEVLPIRLLSYFYPLKYIPIFNLEHLEIAAKMIGGDLRNNGSKGEKLYALNKFFNEKFQDLEIDNYTKSMIIYSLKYTYDVYESVSKGKRIEEVIRINGKGKKWINIYLQRGYDRLCEMGILRITKDLE